MSLYKRKGGAYLGGHTVIKLRKQPAGPTKEMLRMQVRALQKRLSAHQAGQPPPVRISQRSFVPLARAIARVRGQGGDDRTLNMVSAAVADAFGTYKGFDRDRFLRACLKKIGPAGGVL